MTIWKFTVPLPSLNDSVGIHMPRGAKVLSVGNQDEVLCIWAIVDPNAKKEDRWFCVVGTGNPMPDLSKSPFIGTVQFMGGKLVLHVFEQ